MQAMESAFDVCTEDLFNQTVKLEEMEKKAGNAESEVSSLRSRLILLQENNEKQEERMAKATLELAGSCLRADQAIRKIFRENYQLLKQMQGEEMKWQKELKKKIMDIEEELKVVGQNLQTLEVGEEKTIQREEKSQEEILELVYKLKRSDYRGEQAEMNIQRLNVRIDQVEADLLGEKYKIKKISDDLNQVFEDMINMSV